jgi:hypothetical protein
MKYQVTTGIFEGLIFNGCVRIGGRVLNLDTTGQSYPQENVIYLPELKTFEIVQHTFYKGLNKTDIVKIVKSDFYYTIFTINKGKKEYKLENSQIEGMIQNYKNHLELNS